LYGRFHQRDQTGVGAIGQGVDRPPTQVQGFLADDGPRVRRGGGDELQVQMPGRGASEQVTG